MSGPSVSERRAAAARAAATPWGVLGCLGALVAAWPEAFAQRTAGDLAAVYRAGSVLDVLTAALGNRVWPPEQAGELADPCVVFADNRLVAALILRADTVWLPRPAGGIYAPRRWVVARWEIAQCLP